MRRDAATNYRLDAAQFASPVGVIVEAYDQIIRALRAAATALENGNIERKTREVSRALQLISHLQSALDHEAGPKVAESLDVFYETMRYQIIKAAAQPSGDALRNVTRYFGDLYGAWQVVERDNAVSYPATGGDLELSESLAR